MPLTALDHAPQSKPVLQRSLDIMVSAITAPLVIGGLAVHDLIEEDAGLLPWTSSILTIAPIVLRRRASTRVFSISLAGLLLLFISAGPPTPGFAVFPALYSVAAHRSFRRALTACIALELVVVLAAVLHSSAASVDDSAAALSILTVFALLLGLVVGTQRRYRTVLEERGQQHARERAQDEALAAVVERSVIAQEMHNAVARQLTTVTAFIDAAAQAAQADSGAAQTAIERAAQSTRDVQGEMHRLLKLRHGASGPRQDSQLTLAELPNLFEEYRTRGLPVHLTTEGRLDDLQPSLQIALCTVIRKSLDNVLVHADGADRVVVRLQRGGPSVTLTVHDNGRPRRHLPPAGGGLRAMRARAALFDGWITVANDSDGWTVRGVFEGARSDPDPGVAQL